MGKLRVLVVDDAEWIRRGLRAILEEMLEGFVVAGQAENGVQALNLLQSQEFDLAIVDIRMPDMDGIELMRTMRARGLEIPLVVLSGYDDYQYMRAAINSGVADYLLKPVNRLEFSEVMLKLKQRLTKADSDEQANAQGNQREIYLVRQIRQIVAARLNEDLSLQDIADALQYSYNYLSYLFKRETGQNFSEYLTAQRMEKAKRLLRSSGMKIYEVAECCGYRNVKYFINAFHKVVGITPTQYKNQICGIELKEQ